MNNNQDTTQTPAFVKVNRALSQTAMNDDRADGCYICQQALYLSFFFDEPGHDAEREKGTEKITNLGKLYYSHAEQDTQRGVYPSYFNGLGVAFNERNQAVQEAAKDVATNNAKQLAKDRAIEAGKATLMRDWKDWLDPKKWGVELLGIAAKVGIESSRVRDNAAVAQITLSGVETRVENALKKVAQTVKMQKLKVSKVHIAVFDAGMGGALARLFVNKLVQACTANGDALHYPTKDGAAVLQIHFLGLLDCISATFDDNLLVSKVTGTLSLGMATLRVNGAMGIPSCVEKTVHYVAGHEVSVTRRVDSVSKAKGRFTEQVLPGNHHDIVGGLASNLPGRSNQLARCALLELYYEAFGAGVPMLSMEKLDKKDTYLYDSFQFTNKLNIDSVKYGARALARAYGTTSGSLKEQLIAHQMRFIGWMRWHHLNGEKSPPGPSQSAFERVADQVKFFDRNLRTQSLENRTLLAAWRNPVALDGKSLNLFNYFVHDDLFDIPLNNAVADWASHGYLTWRGVDASDEVEAPQSDKKVAAYPSFNTGTAAQKSP